MPKGKLASTLG